MEITNINIRPANGPFQQVYFSTEAGKYVANINFDDEAQSTLYSFGKPGDACVTTKIVKDEDLLIEVAKIARNQNAS